MTLEMTSIYASAALLCALTVLVTAQQPTVELQITEKSVKPGKQVTLTCRIENKGDNTFILSKPFDRPGAEYTDIIATQTILTSAPASTGRYTLEKFTITESVQLYKITIENVTAEDSGPYACSLLGVDGVGDLKHFHVYHPIQSLTFNDQTENGILEVNETSPINVSCVADGSIPAANVQIFLGSEEITHKFRKRTGSMVHCKEGSPDKKKCLTYETFTETAYNDAFQPTYMDNGKQLRCVAEVKDSGYPQMEVAYEMRIPYAPRFINCQREVMGRLHETDFYIRCEVASNPKYPDFRWEFVWGGKTVHLSNNDKTASGEIQAGQDIKENDRVAVWLKINRLNKRHFMTFTLTANNSLGENTMSITLKEDPRYRISLPPDDTVNGCRTNVGTALVVLPLALLKYYL